MIRETKLRLDHQNSLKAGEDLQEMQELLEHQMEVAIRATTTVTTRKAISLKTTNVVTEHLGRIAPKKK
jgi:hypothetical protein